MLVYNVVFDFVSLVSSCFFVMSLDVLNVEDICVNLNFYVENIHILFLQKQRTCEQTLTVYLIKPKTFGFHCNRINYGVKKTPKKI